MSEKPSSRLSIKSIDEIRQMIESAGMPPSAHHAAIRELEGLANADPGSDGYAERLAYLDCLISLHSVEHVEQSHDLDEIKALFGVDLPFSRQAQDSILQRLTSKLSRNHKNRYILIVDDEKIALDSLTHALSTEGYTVIAAGNGDEAIRHLQSIPFDVVITDLIMGEVDGYSVLKEIRRNHPDTHVIMVTGYATVDTAVEAMRMGAFHYIEKPVRIDELRTAVKDALRQKTALSKGAVLCFSGCSDAEKETLGRAVTAALGRKFIRISLSGMQDVSGILGRSRVNQEGRPGCIIEAILESNTSDPVIMLDGLDTINQGSIGAFTSAIMELLDPVRNLNFVDRYVNAPFSLSSVMFMAAAEDAGNIAGPLRDILEVIECQGREDMI